MGRVVAPHTAFDGGDSMKGSGIPASTVGAIAMAAMLGCCHAALATGEKHALLIGIQDYGSSQVPSLNGPHQDIDLVEATLKDAFGVSKIDKLVDAEATHTGVRKAFEKLTKDVKPGDFVYIHFSGHGSHTPDLNGDEERGDQDQTWVTYGARSGAQSGIDDFGILDDEINAWLKPILAKTGNLVFVSDSCHSASVTRGKVTGVRSVDGDNREHPLGRQTFDRADPTSDEKLAGLADSASKKRGVRIGAARDHETAIEIEAEDGKTLWSLYLVLGPGAGEGEAWSDLGRRLQARLHPCQHTPRRPSAPAARGRWLTAHLRR